METAGANVYQAQLNLSYTRITTPVAGVSSFASVNVGAYIDQANSLLTYVAPLDPMYVNFSISENQLLKNRAEESQGVVRAPNDNIYEIEVVLADGSVFDQKGRITFEAPDYDLKTGTFMVRGTLSNPKGTLRPGQFVRVRLLGVTRLNAILVPQKAVLQGAQGHFVVLVDKDRKALIRSVEIGPWNGDDIFITKGLVAGDTVVVEGVARLSPGSPVKVVATGAAPATGPATGSVAEAAGKSSPGTVADVLPFLHRPADLLHRDRAGDLHRRRRGDGFAAHRPIPPDHADPGPGDGDLPGRQRHPGGPERGRTHRAAGERRQQHDLHVVD